MELLLERYDFQEKSTIGKLYINAVFFCYTLEDIDRKLENGGIKQDHITAIPRGLYQVIIDMSTRFKKLMPHILNVPQFEGIRIHSGNSDIDTEGCIILGQNPKDDWISNSRDTFNQFFTQLQSAINNKEKVTILVR